MTITAVRQISTSESVDAEGHQTYQSVYEVQSDTPTENPATVRAAVSFTYGSVYSWGGVTNNYAYCIGLSTQPDALDETHLKWRVQVTHSTKTSTTNNRPVEAGLVTDPISEPWRISGSYVTTTRAATKDRNGRAIQNSAHEPKVIETPSGYDTLRLTGPTATIDLDVRATATNKCNSAAIWGFATRNVYLAQWQYEIRSTGSSGQYVYHDLEFWLKADGWTDEILDQGTREYLGAAASTDLAKRYRSIVPLNDSHVGEWLLNGAGRLADPALLPDGFFLEFEVIEEYDFTAIGLPNPLPGPFV